MNVPSSLQTPRSGRSRFSKALPTPPPGLGDQETRGLPSLPPAPVPPRKNTVLAKSASAVSLRRKAVESPLPALPVPPPAMEAPQLQIQTRMIPRKPVGQSATPPTTATTKVKKMRRVSSISSILSAYSHSSSDSAQRSSHESDFTKDSEPSYSPEREDLQPKPAKTLVNREPTVAGHNGSGVTESTIVDSFPPPPSAKDVYRPRTPSLGKLPHVEAVTSSPNSLTNTSPKPGREIWRRRASSKSDRSLVIANLKLPESHGSTAITTQAASGASKVAEPAAPQPPPKTIIGQSSESLPPRNASLPGRNIRPLPQPAPIEKDDDMKLKLPKLKELIHRSGDKDLPAIKEPLSAQTSQSTIQAQQPSSTPEVPAPPPKESGNPNVIARRPLGSQPRVHSDPEPEQEKPEPKTIAKPTGLHLATPSLGSARPAQTPGTLPHPRQRLTPNPSPNPSVGPSSGRPQDLGVSTTPSVVQPPTSPESGSLQTMTVIKGPKDQTQINREDVRSPPQGSFVPPPAMMTAPRFDKSAIGNTQPHTLSDVQENPDWNPNARRYNDDDFDEQREPMSEQAARAVALFPQHQNWNVQPTANGTWPSVPLDERHFNCFGNHARFVTARNTYYALTCQICSVPDTSPRRCCASCNLRICVPCHDLLLATSRDLKQTVALLQGKGKEKT